MNTISHLLIFLIMIINPVQYSSSAATPSPTFSFTFPTFSSHNNTNLTLLGSSHFQNDTVSLTLDSPVPTTSSGTLLFSSPIPFFDPSSNTSSSFSSHFSFSLSDPSSDSSPPSHGLSFFLSPSPNTLGSPGSFLGLVNSSHLTKNRFIAIEFDTRLDPIFHDPDDNHVGLDIESLVSIKTASLYPYGINLRSGKVIHAWIDYKNDSVVRVFVSKEGRKPDAAVLEVEIDLGEYLKEFMFLGFSGSTEGSTEVHRIESWSFECFGFEPLRSRSSHNVSADSSVVVVPMIPGVGTRTRTRKRFGLGVGIGVPAFCCALVVVFGWVSIRRWNGIRQQRCIFKAEIVPGPREFTYKELKLATRGFHSSQIIGRGAFGTVYKAFFVSSGTMSAVKRSKHPREGKSDFLAELSIIACLRHKNLVQLQGWCIEKDELLLVYEFMPNGSLDLALYDASSGPNPGSVLPWASRYNIAVGLASVLSYLHQECEQQVVHRDIKASNVMLDANFNARLGDFGLARLMEHDRSPVSTLTAGTMGYLAPEYLQLGTASDKTDVFSYGVVMLELACGRRPIEKEVEGQRRMVNLVDHVWGLYGEGRIIEACDGRLKGEFVREEMEMLLMVGLSCAHPDCAERPNMRRVLQILNKEADPLVVPRTKPTLLFSCSLPLSIEDIVSDDDEVGYGNNSEKGIRRTQDQFEIDIGTPRGNSH